MRPSPLPALLGLLLLLGAPAKAADAAPPSVADIQLGESLAGPKISAKTLQNRVVIFANWDDAHTNTIIHLADLQAPYLKDGKVMVVANYCGKGSVKEALALWQANSSAKELPAIHGGHIPGANDANHLWVFNGLGKLTFDGQANSPKVVEAIRGAVKFTGQGMNRGQMNLMARTRDMFGDNLHPELLKMGVLLADDRRPSAPALAMLARGAKSKKLPILAAQAERMIGAFDNAIAKEWEQAMALADTDPPQAADILTRLARWVPQKKEGADAKAKLAEWNKRKAFTDEMAADKLWQKMAVQGEKLDFGKNPKQKPPADLIGAYAQLQKKYPTTAAMNKAKAMAKEWRLEPAQDGAGATKGKATGK